MTDIQTDYRELLKWWNLMPKEIQLEIPLVPLRFQDKAPMIPEGWLDDRTQWLTIGQAVDRLKAGLNVGAYGMPKGIVIGDFDQVAGAVPYFKKEVTYTTAGWTRNHHANLFWINKGINNKKIGDSDGEIFSLRAIKSYTVTPGGFVPPDEPKGDGRYYLENAIPPIELRPEMLGDWYNKNGSNDGTVNASVPIDFGGHFMSLPCIKHLFTTKLKDGRRSRFAKILSIAWLKDHNNSVGGFGPVAKAYCDFQSDQQTRVVHCSVVGWCRSATRSNYDWNCGEIVLAYRNNKIYDVCLDCPMKGWQKPKDKLVFRKFTRRPMRGLGVNIYG